MPKKVYGSNLYIIIVFILTLLMVSYVFNFFIFSYRLSVGQFGVVSIIISSIILYISHVKKVYLYEDEIVFKKVFSTESVRYEDIYRIALKGTNHYDSIDYFVLLDANEEMLMEIYTGLIGNPKKQHDFIDMLVSKNNNIITE